MRQGSSAEALSNDQGFAGGDLIFQQESYSFQTQAGVVPTASAPNRSGVVMPGLPDNWNSMSYADYRRSHTKEVSAWLDYKASGHWNLRAGYSRPSTAARLGASPATTCWCWQAHA